MNEGLKAIHDRLLAEKPEGAAHDVTGCPLCATSEEGLNVDAGDRMTTYSEEQVKAKVDEAVKEAVAAATASLEAQVRDLAEKAKTDEVKTAQDAVRAELEPQVADLQKQLDAKVVEAANAAAETEAIMVWLQGEAAAQEQAQVFAARKDERLTKIKTAAPNLPDEYLAANTDRFVAMADEDFQAVIDGWAAQSGKQTASRIPAETAMHYGGGGGLSNGAQSAVKDLLAMRREQGRQDLSGLAGRV